VTDGGQTRYAIIQWGKNIKVGVIFIISVEPWHFFSAWGSLHIAEC